jgi:hypothetical protein
VTAAEGIDAPLVRTAFILVLGTVMATMDRRIRLHQGEQQVRRTRSRELFRTGSVAGRSRDRTSLFPRPLVLAPMLVGAVGLR